MKIGNSHGNYDKKYDNYLQKKNIILLILIYLYIIEIIILIL